MIPEGRIHDGLLSRREVSHGGAAGSKRGGFGGAAGVSAGGVSHVWYFAYGSNMQTETFRGRRGIEPRRAVAAGAAGWRLVLDKPPLIPMDEAFANLVRDPTATVLGVLYEITPDDLAHVDLTEGVLIGNYERIRIDATPLAAGGVPVEAFTLVAGHRVDGLLPSRRYMACLIAGAEEHGLPAEYVAFLRGVPAKEESAEAIAFRPLFEDALRRRKPPDG